MYQQTRQSLIKMNQQQQNLYQDQKRKISNQNTSNNSEQEMKLLELGNSLQSKRCFKESKEVWEKLIKINPLKAEYQFYLADAFANLSNDNGAIQSVSKAINLQHNNAYFHCFRANLYLKESDFQQALYDIETAEISLKKFPLFDANIQNYISLTIQNKKLLYQQLRQPLQSQSLKGLPIMKTTLIDQESIKKEKEKTSQFNSIKSQSTSNQQKISEQDLQSLCQQGKQEIKNHNYRIAQQCFEKAILINSKSYEALYGLSLTQIEFNQYEQSLQNLDKCISLQNNNINAYIKKSQVLRLTKQNQLALKVIDQALLIEKNNQFLLTQKDQIIKILNHYVIYQNFKKKSDIKQTAQQNIQKIIDQQKSQDQQNEKVQIQQLKIDNQKQKNDEQISIQFEKENIQKDAIKKNIQQNKEINIQKEDIQKDAINLQKKKEINIQKEDIQKDTIDIEKTQKDQIEKEKIQKDKTNVKNNLKKDIEINIENNLNKQQNDFDTNEKKSEKSTNFTNEQQPISNQSINELQLNLTPKKQLDQRKFSENVVATKTNEKLYRMMTQIDNNINQVKVQIDKNNNQINEKIDIVISNVSRILENQIELTQILQESGFHDKAKIKQGFQIIFQKNLYLYTYCKSFYWNLLNYLSAYRQLTTGLQSSRKEGLMKVDPKTGEIVKSNVSSVMNIGVEIVSYLPIVGTAVSSIDSIIKHFWIQFNQMQVQEKAKIINKIVMHKIIVEDDISILVAKMAIQMTTLRENEIINLVKGIELKQHSKMMKYIKKITSKIYEQKDLQESPCCKLAIKDIILILIFVFQNYEEILNIDKELNIIIKEVIQQGNLDDFLNQKQKIDKCIIF